MKKLLLYILFLFFSLSVYSQLQFEEIVTTPVSCNGGTDGTITISISGGKSPYYYYYQKGGDIHSSPLVLDTIYTFINVKANNWFVLVEDDNGDIISSVGPVTQPAPISITSEIVTDISCNGDNDGTISVTATGESGSYQFDLAPLGLTSFTGNFTNLPANTYSVAVTDATGCSTSDVTNPLIVSDPDPISITVESSSDMSCAGVNDGNVTVSATGGTGTLVYTLNPGAIQTNTTGIFNGLGAGTYSVDVTDSNGCPTATSNNLTVNEPPVLMIDSESSTDITCNGADDGTITISASGGVGPYTFVLNPGGSSNGTGIFSGLSPGIYTVDVSDVNGCGPVTSSPITLNEPAAISITSSLFTDVTCNGSNDGTITVTATGGNAPLDYTLNPGSINNMTGVFSGLPGGDYTVTVNDAGGCPPAVTPLITITDPAPITIDTEASTDITCNGANDGTVTVSASGGTGTLYYTLNPGAIQNTTGSFTGLGPATYTVSVTDDNACPPDVSNNLIVAEPAALVIDTETATDITCNASDDGTVTISVSGGTGPYTFTLNPGAIQVNGTGVFTGLGPGTYTVDVEDAASCPIVTSSPLTVNEPAVISVTGFTSSDISCNGMNDGEIHVTGAGGTAPLTYTLNPGAVINGTGDFTGLSGGDYSVTIDDANGCPSAVIPVITITDPAPISISNQSSTDITCNGLVDGTITVAATGGTGTLQYTLNPGAITNTTGSFTGLAAGTYDVTVDDQNGCPSVNTGNIDISEPAVISVIVEPGSKLALDCFGDNDGSIDITISGGTGAYSVVWTGPSSYTSTSQDISGLFAGNYSLEVTDGNSCVANFPDLGIITEPPQLTISLTKTDVVCYGDANATITVTAGGGTGPYEYSRNGITYQGSNVFTGLTQNTYTIYVRDANGCIVTDNIDIVEPAELLVTSEIRIDNNLCYGDSLGEIRILTVEGGITPYEYSIDGGVNYYISPDFQQLPAGDYQTVVRDVNGCTATGNLNHINEPQEIKIINYTQVDVTGCFESVNGQIAIEAGGGTGIKNYSLDGGPTNTTGIFNPVSGGAHLITITDANACTKDTTVNILSPPDISYDAITITDVTGCTGDSNGEISIAASGGTGVLNYSIDGGAFQAIPNFTGLISGDHVLSILDANNCQKDSTVTVGGPTPVVIDSELSTNLTCSGDDDGTITINASGGSAPYNFTLNPGALSNATGMFTNLTPGTYNVSVTDNNGCGPVLSSDIDITSPAPLNRDSVINIDILCSGDDDAEIHIFASGGTRPFVYSIDDGANYYPDSVFTALVPGTYHLSVRDDNACLLILDTITFIDPTPLNIISETKTDIAVCNGDSTGSVEFVVNGGTGAIEYSIDNGINWQANGLFSNLPGADYTVIARDANSCTITSSTLTVVQPPAITADIIIVDQLDDFNPGSIDITNAAGGTGILEFSINGLAGPFSSTTFYPDLVAGFYDVVIRDGNMCTYEETVEVELVPPLDVTVTITHSSCNGSDDGSILIHANDPVGIPEYSIDDSATWSANELFEDLPAGEYIIFARDEDGRYFNDTVIVNEPVAIGIFRNITPASCSNLSEDGAIDITVNGASGTVSYSWSNGATSEDLNGITAGIYILDVVDENSCSASDTITVPALTDVTADAGSDTAICFGETLILNGQGGTTASWSPTGGLSNPNILNPVVDTDTSISYILTVVGLNDCFDMDTIDIIVHPSYGLDAGNDTSVLRNGSVLINTTGGPYESYLWEPSTGVDDVNSANPTITPVNSANYIVSGLTAEGCYDRDTLRVEVIENLIIYNAFSPNNDGKNDFWDIEYAEYYSDIIVEVYTRWGEKLFSSVGYTDDRRWDGTHKGKDVPLGTYYYVVIPYKGATALTGPVTIVR